MNSKKRFSIDKVLAHPWLQGTIATHDEVRHVMSLACIET